MYADRRSGAPPRLATALLVARLPAEIAEAIAGDIEHEYRTRIAPARGPLLADAWYWAQVFMLRAGSLRRAARRLRAVRPTWEPWSVVSLAP